MNTRIICWMFGTEKLSMCLKKCWFIFLHGSPYMPMRIAILFKNVLNIFSEHKGWGGNGEIMYVHVNCFWNSQLLLYAKMYLERWVHKFYFMKTTDVLEYKPDSFWQNQNIHFWRVVNALQLLKGGQFHSAKHS